MSLAELVQPASRLVLLAVMALAGVSVRAQFAAVPQPQKAVALQPSHAANEKSYRIDAARHIYDAYPAQILKGKVPPLVYAILVTETEIDARGKVLNVRVVRPPAAARGEPHAHRHFPRDIGREGESDQRRPHPG